MAHSYSNFADAFAALCARNSVYRGFVEDCYDMCDEADDKANAGDYMWGIRYSVYAIKALATALDQIIHGQYFEPENSWFYESFYWLGQEGNGVVDMDAIINAMLAAEFDELRTFTGLTDAYRVALWNEPFNAEYYAALARGFSRE